MYSMVLNVSHIKVPSNVTVTIDTVNEVGGKLLSGHIKGFDTIINCSSLNMKYDPMNHHITHMGDITMEIDEDGINRLKLLNDSLIYRGYDDRDVWYMGVSNLDVDYFIHITDEKNGK